MKINSLIFRLIECRNYLDSFEFIETESLDSDIEDLSKEGYLFPFLKPTRKLRNYRKGSKNMDGCSKNYRRYYLDVF
jgi:hypothetical protein